MNNKSKWIKAIGVAATVIGGHETGAAAAFSIGQRGN